MGIACRVIVEHEKKVLIGRRAPGYEGEKWNIFGGKSDEGESPIQAASRELFEETGIVATQLVEYLVDQDNDWTSYYFVLLFEPAVMQTVADDEHDEMRWVSEAELDQLEAEFAFNHYLILKQYFVAYHGSSCNSSKSMP